MDGYLLADDGKPSNKDTKMRKITMTANEITIIITERDGKCLYQISGVPNRAISKAVEELKATGVGLAMAVKMLAPIVLK